MSTETIPYQSSLDAEFACSDCPAMLYSSDAAYTHSREAGHCVRTNDSEYTETFCNRWDH